MKKLLIFFVGFFCIFQADATHLMGGEITWQCLSNGRYIFRMKLYKDCNQSFPVQGYGQTHVLDVTGHPSVFTIPLTLIDSIDISPQCDVAGPVFNCNNPGNGAHMEFNFISAQVQLTGVPPASGWAFSWGINCCRNMAVQNLASPATYGITLRAVMYSYNGLNADPCFDSSPVFAQRPAIVLCGAYPMNYNHNAYDPDLDSLEYSWARPLRDYFGSSYSSVTNAPFAAGFSYTNPFPDANPPNNPANVPATLDPVTGQISFTSFNTGYFVTVVKVTAYKCGIKVAEIYRDIQVIILNCPANIPPSIYPPFNNGTSFDTTIVAGGVVDFMFLATDSGWSQSFANNQYITFTASGSQFDSNFVSTISGCLHPPCATLLPQPFPVRQLRDSVFFHWQTTCDHINYGNQGGGPCSTPVVQNKYTFVITAKDDFCPSPGLNVGTINITVVALPVAGTPEIRCASVLPNGDVELTWIPPLDPGGTFADYYILSSTSAAGPFIAIDSSINILATNSFIHVGASANTTNRFYMLRSRSGCFGKVQSYPSDTLQAIRVDVTNPGTGYASVSWNPLHSPPLASSTGWYRIFRKINSGPWVLHDSTQSTFYSDPLFKCNDTASYYVEIDDLLPCTSRSTEDSDIFFDSTPPDVPVTDSVSVDPTTNLCLIGWEVSTSLDTRGYLIYQADGPNTFLDTVFGINSTFYTTTFAATGPHNFRIVAYDSCGNKSPFNTKQQTLWLTAQLNTCLQGAELSWNEYINWPNNVTGYEIYSSENGAPFILVGTVGGSTTTYFDAPINQNSSYRYYVHAIGGFANETSTSNYATLVAYVIKLPQFLYLRTASVESDKNVRVDLHVDATADVTEYLILRAQDTLVGFDTIATIAANGSSLVSINDTSAETAVRSYYYKAMSRDICGVLHPSDNYGKTIFLEAKVNDDLTNSLTWSDYEDWSGGVEKYGLYRNVSGIWETNSFTDVNFGTTFFRDDISSFIDSDGNFCYYIKANEAIGNIYGFTDTSYSNIACVIQGPRLYTPNAFTPGGRNPIFYPINAFIDLTSYRFTVYNRWGTQIFESVDSKEGWDGTIGGSEGAPGVYVYLLELTGTNGKALQRKGTIALIR